MSVTVTHINKEGSTSELPVVKIYMKMYHV